MYEKSALRKNLTCFVQSRKDDLEVFDIESQLFAQKSGFQLLALRDLLVKVTEWMTDWCVDVLENRSLVHDLEEAKFDLAIVDGLDFFRCSYTIPYRLKIPYVTLTARHDPWSAGIPSSPAGEGMMGLNFQKNDPTFFERLANLCVYIAGNTINPRYVVPDELIVKYVPDRDATTFDELFRRSEMFLVNREVFCMDYPRMHTPHYQFLGGFGVRPAQPLPPDLERFVQGSEQAGIVVLTFGSAISHLPPEIIAKLFAGLRVVKQRVVMRLAGEFADVPPNVWLGEWLPQNDLLGHAKTRLFITHGGANGQMEALYHGVPMLTMPLFGDQAYNAEASQDKGFGLTLDPFNFTSEQLRDAIDSMLDDRAKYRENIARCSAIIRSFPSAQDRFTFWIEHILRFGGSHLRPSFVDLPMWKLFMVDIAAFCLVVLVSVAAVCRCCCRCVKRKWRRKGSKAKTD